MSLPLSRPCGVACVLTVSLFLPACSKNQDSEAALGTLGGTLDRADQDAIAGWAWDPAQPDTPLNVDIYDGNTLLATVTADKLRKDLVDSRKGNGCHGFRFSTPAALKDGRSHSIRARISGTKVELQKSPKSVTFRSQ